MACEHDARSLLLGLIGEGLDGSRTPAMHEAEAQVQGLRCLYQRIDLARLGLSVGALPDLLTAAERMGFTGLNITHPCKQAVLPLLTDISGDARAIGAVNTVVFERGGRSGHNTDWSGFRQSMLDGLPDARLGRVVQLGAGGAGSATAYAMMRMGAEELTVIDLVSDRAQQLAGHMASIFGRRVRAAQEIASALENADGLIHATPTGMTGHPGLPLPASCLRRDLWVADVVYFPIETELLRAARHAGCRTLDGRGMAVHQAVEAFRLFAGAAARPERMRATFDAFDVPPARGR
jgi:quinate/shikimate dehydrogenase (NAD+)